jgi:hypothetical protein
MQEEDWRDDGAQQPTESFQVRARLWLRTKRAAEDLHLIGCSVVALREAQCGVPYLVKHPRTSSIIAVRACA